MLTFKGVGFFQYLQNANLKILYQKYTFSWYRRFVRLALVVK